MRRVRFVLAVGVFTCVVVGFFFFHPVPPQVEACGPFFVHPVFVTTWTPDPPLEPFAAGRLGHVRSTWARRYLFVAYRYLSGRALTKDEQRMFLTWPSVDSEESGVNDGQDWRTARASVVGEEPPAVKTARRVPRQLWSFTNCPDDAFRTAANTLRARAAVFGVKSAEMTEWVRAQDEVFSNCSDKGTIPVALPASAPPLARQDRAYQVAAALFYATDYDAAENAFREIARDTASPWHRIAPYLAARCLVRKGTVKAPEDSFDRASLEQAARELRAFVAASTDPRERTMAEQVLGFVELRVAPVERTRVLGSGLALGTLGPRFGQALYDYATLLNRAHGEVALDDRQQQYARAQKDFARLSELRATADLTDWIITFQAAGPGATTHAIARWRETHSDAWLVAALDKTTRDGEATPALLAAASALKPDSPAYATGVYHTIRLLLDRGQQAQAREKIDGLLTAATNWPRSVTNELLAWRFALARNLDEFVRFAPRVAAAEGDDFGLESSVPTVAGPGAKSREHPSLRWRFAFDLDAASMLSRRLPVALLQQVAENQALPEWLRQEVGLAAWTRAVLLGDDNTARRLFGFLERAVPSLSADLRTYRQATTASDREHAATLLLLKLPGLRPSVAPGLGRETAEDEGPARLSELRDNWWCAAGAFSGLSSYQQASEQQTPAPSWPAFLDEPARAAARQEEQRMQVLPTAPIVLCHRAVAWAKQTPDDPRIPEALALAVRASRYGCWTEDTTAASRAAFQLLKARYGNTKWAKETKYYY